MLLTIFDNMLPSAGSFPAGEEETQSKSAGVLHRCGTGMLQHRQLQLINGHH